MKKILFALLCALIFVGCENENAVKGRKLYKAYYKKMLKDPSSFKVYKEEYKIDGGSVRWTLDYGAKNGYGAMGRETESFTTTSDMISIGGTHYFMEELR